MRDAIKPADGGDWWGYYRHYGEYLVADAVRLFDPQDIAHDRRRALAALCLHGQPFGFTREDVDEITRAAVRAESDGLQGISFNLRGIAARIAALLPPEDT